VAALCAQLHLALVDDHLAQEGARVADRLAVAFASPRGCHRDLKQVAEGVAPSRAGQPQRPGQGQEERVLKLAVAGEPGARSRDSIAELAWTLDYEDAPEPEDADPRLDFSAGALLVPATRWNEHAAVEPNLAPCSHGPTKPRAPRPTVPAASLDDPHPSSRQTAADVAARAIVAATVGLAVGYLLG
jgi:hypothetical protein